MSFKLKDCYFRKLKISDYEEFRKLFYSCFKKKISFEFFKWRYFSDKYSFCYGVFNSARLIANVGMVSVKLNNNSNYISYSRHSSMVLKKYRGKGVFSELLDKVKKKFSKKIDLVLMWPNKNNFASFGLNKKNITNKKYYLYKTFFKFDLLKKNKIIPISKIIEFQKFFGNDNCLFSKDLVYFRKRYLLYREKDYFLNKLEHKNSKSFFILKRNKDQSGLNHVILDHFGSKKLYSLHLSHLINSQKNLIFLSEKKYNNSKYRLINCINLKIGFIKKTKIKEKQKSLINKKVFLGDTDTFITI